MQRNCRIVLLNLSSLLFLLFNRLKGVPHFSGDGTDPQYVVADTLYGKVRGVRTSSDPRVALEVFLGVPYAKPPVGDLRLSRPQFPAPWKGVRDALQFGNMCIQACSYHEKTEEPLMVNLGQSAFAESEDCLYLNIYAPRLARGPKQLPVLIWIHGGGFRCGGGNLYNATQLALTEIVVVTINYRLDVFGFLSTADRVIPGNFGMLDQVLALEWVRDNIQTFGGDPNAVTLAGQSAGAMSVSMHLLSPLTRGKFQRAIMQSGSSLMAMSMNRSNSTYFAPREMAKVIGLAVGCSHYESVEFLSCLRNARAEKLIKASVELQQMLDDGLIWRPVKENVFGFMPNLPSNIIANGKVMDVPTIRGYNTNEMAYKVIDPDNQGLSRDDVIKEMTGLTYFYYQKNNYKIELEVEKEYTPSLNDMIGNRDTYARMISDMFISAAVTYEALLYSELQQRQAKDYFYEFAHRPSFSPLPLWMGVVHGDELQYMMGLILGMQGSNAEDLEVATTMMTLWSNFVKTGNPALEAILEIEDVKQTEEKAGDEISNSHTEGETNLMNQILRWPSFDNNTNTMLKITATPSVGNFVKLRASDLWMVRIPKLEKEEDFND